MRGQRSAWGSPRRQGALVLVVGALLACAAGVSSAAAPSAPTGGGELGTITIAKKVVFPGGESTSFRFELCPLDALSSSTDVTCPLDIFNRKAFHLDDGESKSFDLVSGEYRLAETVSVDQFSQGWRSVNDSDECTGAVPAGLGSGGLTNFVDTEVGVDRFRTTFANVVIEPGTNVLCVFRNYRYAGLFVRKVTPTPETQDFSLTFVRCQAETAVGAFAKPTRCARSTPTELVLDTHPLDPPDSDTEQPKLKLRAGVYMIREGGPPHGWLLDSIACLGADDRAIQQVVDLANNRVFVRVLWGEQATCVFSNMTAFTGSPGAVPPVPTSTVPPRVVPEITLPTTTTTFAPPPPPPMGPRTGP